MNKYVYIILGVLILIGVSLYIGNSMGKKEQKNAQIKKEIKYIQVDNKLTENKIDSLNSVIKSLEKKDLKLKKQESTVKEKAEKITIDKPVNKECDDLYNKATTKIGLLNTVISTKDSIENNLRTTIDEKDNVINLKDRIISNKDEEIRLTKELGKPRNKKIVIGLQLGTGGAVSKNNNNLTFQYVPVYVGVGITYKLFEF